MKKTLKRLLSSLLVVCLVAAFAPAALAASDIDGHWAQATMQKFIDQGWLKGYGNEQYGPDDPLTYVQFTTIISRVSGEPVESTAAAENKEITREDAVVLVADLLGLADSQTDLAVLNRFSDSGEISSEARGSVAAMVAAGYIEGTDVGTFLPAKTLTRAEGVTILDRALEALTAPEVPTTGTVYGTATLTYAEFYSGDVSSVDGYGIDGVSSATTSKYSIMSNMYTNFQDAETNADGYNILGVKNVNVAVDAADYQAYVAINPTFKISRTVPEQYKTVTISNGKAVYSATNFNVADTVTDAVAALKTGSVWGDYEIDITETSTQHLRNSREDTFDINSQIQGVILETKDGLRVGMEYLQSIWVQPYEVSFNVSADSEYNAHIAAWDNLNELSKLVGASITSITYIMQDSTYIYEFSDGIYIKPVYNGSETIKASFVGEGSAELTITGVPAALQDVTVTVTSGSGRGSVTVADAVEIKDGKVTMDSPYDPAQTYTVKVSSSNYADIVADLPVNATQLEQLRSLVDQAKTLIENGTAANDDGLKEHYEEAQALLADTGSATSAEAADLISELTEHLSVYITVDTGSQQGGGSRYQH